MARQKQYSYWIADAALAQAVKAKADAQGIKLAEAVTHALQAWVGTKTGARPLSTVVAADRAVLARRLEAEHVLEPSAPADCRRCGHPASMHWKRGCVAGCTCRKFVPAS